ncbi:hypothetical protein B0T24DRAFT_718243 [Lasiosphaeria ovina]|uniref:F-box domain-containing protein n=1 Tax=Lasiosphaeria ovina TaxID=92902 RepID=A0AAE0NA54_9PEZI|nr:hypothetical protein B0T24DRAFT_718243 [Lasiosphaeria ovina]
MAQQDPNLGKLPTEILLRIVNNVARDDPPSLVALALVNKRCYSVASTALFRTVGFNISHPARLARHVQQCEDLLQRRGAFGHVRRIDIAGWDRMELWQEGDGPRAYEGIRFPNDNESIKWAYDMDYAWLPLARLIRRLPALADLVYQCPSQFPPCLLQALHEKDALRCRLHHRTFLLRSLNEPVPDPHELALCQSPCLYSIWPRHYHFPFNNDRIAQVEATCQMLERGLAPNLTKVRMRNFPIPSMSPRAAPPPGPVLDPREGASAPAPLRSLLLNLGPDSWRRVIDKDGFFYIDYIGECPRNFIDDWIGAGLLEALQDHLKIEARPTADVLHVLATSCQFSCLSSLAFTCHETQPPEYLNALKHFLGGLPALTSLRLAAWDHDAMSLADALNPKLELLWLRPAVWKGVSPDLDEISRIVARCPAIENLAISVHRSRGDAAEVANHSRSDYDTLVEPHFDDFGREYLPAYCAALPGYRWGHILDIGVLALDSMVLETDGGFNWSNPGTVNDLNWGSHKPSRLLIAGVLRKFIVSRALRDDCRAAGHLWTRECKPSRQVDDLSRLSEEDCEDNRAFVFCFRRLWPAKEPSMPWHEDKHIMDYESAEAGDGKD